MSTLQAGACAVDITPGVGVPMGGYGARKAPAAGIHDPLHVRTLVLSDGTTTLALAVCDLVGVGLDIVEAARTLVAEDLDIPPTNVLISATHTHSGPGSVRIGRDSSDGDAYARTTARKIAGSIAMAKQSMQPVVLKVGSVEVTTMGQNRRNPDGPTETVARVLVAEPAEDPAADVVATLVNYACHATVLEADNLDFSADFPGSMAAFVEQSLGGTAIYLQGAAGDINPVWLRHDFAETDRIGGILGAAAVRTAHEMRPLGQVQRVVNLSWSEDLPVAPAPGGCLIDDTALAAVSRVLEIPQRPLPPRDEIGKKIKSLEVELEQISEADHLLRRRLQPKLAQLRMEWLFAGREGRPEGLTEKVEVQAFRISPDLAVVSLPGEFLVEIGDAIRAASPGREVLIAGYANNYVGYVPRESDFKDGGYEVGCARMLPDAADRVIDTAVELLDQLYAPETADAAAGSD